MGRRFIRIIAVPPGEAPDGIRAAWVGVRIPLLRFHGSAKEWRTAGVLTGPKTFLGRLSAMWSGGLKRENGYVVSAVAAVAALEAKDPEAARWWRENVPVSSGRAFVFSHEVCVVEDDQSPP